MTELKNYIQRNGQIGLPGKNQIYEMVYTQEQTIVRGVEELNSKMRVSIRLGLNSFIMESENLSIYADSANMFYIYHDQKLIQKVSGYKINEMSKNSLLAAEQQMAVFNNCLFKSCSNEDLFGRKVKKIQLTPNQNLKDELKVLDITVFFDSKEQRIYQVSINYLAEHSIKNQTTTYNKVNFNLKGRLMTTAYKMVYNQNGILHKQFKDYSIIDN
jgi:hypothetical protein